jgi:glycosyltransferase involved in cell wall biosynthesis
MTVLEPHEAVGSSGSESLSTTAHCPGTAGARPALRILHLVSSFQVGGMEQFVLRIAAHQRQQGHRVTIMGLRGGPLLDQARHLGVEAVVLEGGKAGRVARALAAIARRRPVIAHAHNPSSLSYALLAKLSVRARVVMTRHGQEAKSMRRSAQWRHLDAIVAVSQAVAASMQAKHANLASRVTIIPNGVHLAGGSRPRGEVRAELGLAGPPSPAPASMTGVGPLAASSGPDIVGIVVARLDRLKGHECLLRALAILRDQQRALTMLLVGDGPERVSLEGLAQQLDLGSDRLRFLGYRSDVSDLLSAADLFVLPSLTEGLPLSVLEAMAHALPVVATPVGGIPEVITDGQDGLLVPVNQPEELARVLSELLDDPARRQSLGETGYRHVRDRFSFERMAGEYEELYRRLLARGPVSAG